MAKRRSVEKFIEDRNALLKAAKVRAYEHLLDTYGVTGEKKQELMEEFKREAEMILRSSVRLPR
jgi:vacuolar-type H+-ATPase subunit H